ncbi:MAG TPA: HAMP domain-containing sensor histidine kinase [Chitinophagaceae bacterium]|jgi:signal transduction histidine kinase
MEKQINGDNFKLTLVMKHASTGLAEIDASGKINSLNSRGKKLLKPIWIAKNINDDNLYTVLESIAPEIIHKIKNHSRPWGNIISDEPYSFTLSFGEEDVERYFTFTVTKISADCIIVDFDDVTENRLKEKAIMELVADKAVAQGKYEIASNVLHDIGNALVGFGSYVNRIKRSLEHNDPENLHKLTAYFLSQQALLMPVLGEAKAGAVINMLGGITESQRKNKEDIGKSITEQLNIINHIQEILHIQKQYLNGHSVFEKKPINLRAIINDCILMLYASMEKREIALAVNVPEKLPAIEADRTRLMQVILNILKNSIEAIDINAPEKKITISARVEKELLSLSICDTGHGFDETTGKGLFTRGFTTKASGTGLGLSNCKAIIESHEGTIGISSDGFGRGATTRIKFKI